MTEQQAEQMLEVLEEVRDYLVTVEWCSRVVAIAACAIGGFILWYYIRDALRGRGLFG